LESLADEPIESIQNMILRRDIIKTSDDNSSVTVETVVWPFPRKKIITLINRPRILPYIDRHDPVLTSNVKTEIDASVLTICFDVKNDYFDENEPYRNKYFLIQLYNCCSLVSTDPEVAFKARFRSDLKRQTKRLGELGKVGLSYVKGEDIDATKFDGFYGLLKESRDSKRNKTRWGLEKNKEMLRQIVNYTNSLFFELTVNDKPIAFAHCLLMSDGLIYLIPTYDSQYSKYSPGMLLFSYLVKYCEEENLILDLGKGDTGYKKKFQTISYPLNAAFVYNSPIGRMLSVPLKYLLRISIVLMRKSHTMITSL
jgi:hypothetical protein